MAALLDSHTVYVNDDIAHRLMRFSLIELTCKEVCCSSAIVPIIDLGVQGFERWESAATLILRLLCEERAELVLDVITKLVLPDVLPQQKLLDAIAECARVQPIAFSLHLERILRHLVPQLAQLKNGSDRIAVSFGSSSSSRAPLSVHSIIIILASSNRFAALHRFANAFRVFKRDANDSTVQKVNESGAFLLSIQFSL
jgi:hypothetical protein